MGSGQYFEMKIDSFKAIFIISIDTSKRHNQVKQRVIIAPALLLI